MNKIVETKKKNKYTFDATDNKVGRLATRISTILIGKNSPDYVPNLDNINRVVVENVDKLVFTGKKTEQKDYRHYSGYPGGLKKVPAKKLMVENPRKVLLHAVSRMLPKNKLRTPRLKRISFK